MKNFESFLKCSRKNRVMASDGVLHQMTWPPQPPDLNPNWDGSGWVGPQSEGKAAQQVLSICGNSFKTVRKASLMKLFERMPRVCKAVIKAKGGYFWRNLKYKIYLDLLKTFFFLVTTWVHIGYFIVLLSSLLFDNVENSTNKEKLLNE